MTSLGTTLGGDEDDTITGSHTIDCSRCSVPKHGDALNILRVDLIHPSLHTIDQDQRRGATIIGIETTEQDLGAISPWCTTGLYSGETGGPSDK